jgi:hypothetical protein
MLAADPHLQRAGGREAAANQDYAEKNGDAHMPRSQPRHARKRVLCGPNVTGCNVHLRHIGEHPRARSANRPFGNYAEGGVGVTSFR